MWGFKRKAGNATVNTVLHCNIRGTLRYSIITIYSIRYTVLYPSIYSRLASLVLSVYSVSSVEAARGLARLRLANFIQDHDFHRDEFCATLRRREKEAYSYDVREAHYNRFWAPRMVRPQNGRSDLLFIFFYICYDSTLV